MKKIIATALVLAASAVAAFAQVLPNNGFKNTTWIGLGKPVCGDFAFYGLMDTLQFRGQLKKVTIDGMLNWSFLANYDNDGDVDNFVFGTSNKNPLSLKYGYDHNTNDYASLGYNNHVDTSNFMVDSFYLNLFIKWNNYFESGAGTKLNWRVGPAPGYGGWLWEPESHIRQGGFSTSYDDRSGAVAWTDHNTDSKSYKFYLDKPGTADVVGFVPYANVYAKHALATRFTLDGNVKLEIGLAVPNGFNTDDPAINLGFRLAPVDWISIGAALQGCFEDRANLYSGVTIAFKYFILDAYFAADSLFTEEDDDVAVGLGAAATFIVPNTEINLRPEVGFNFFEDGHYTPAWYVGAKLNMPLGKVFEFNCWGSVAFGSMDTRWDNDEYTGPTGGDSKDWTGGNVINVRPGVKFNLSKTVSFDAYFDFEHREAFDGESRGCWSSGVLCTILF